MTREGPEKREFRGLSELKGHAITAGGTRGVVLHSQEEAAAPCGLWVITSAHPTKAPALCDIDRGEAAHVRGRRQVGTHHPCCSLSLWVQSFSSNAALYCSFYRKFKTRSFSSRVLRVSTAVAPGSWTLSGRALGKISGMKIMSWILLRIQLS